jgi:nucleoside phosphorylase
VLTSLYPDTPDSLARQLHESVLFRYARLEYCRSHEGKLRSIRPPEDVIGSDVGTTENSGQISIGPRSTPVQPSKTTKQSEQTSRYNTEVLTLSETNASTFYTGWRPTSSLFPPPSKVASSTIIGKVTTPLPPTSYDTSENPKCPFCRIIHPRQYYDDKSWWRYVLRTFAALLNTIQLTYHGRTHVENDLQPYICLTGSCDDAHEFGEKKAWSSHMAEKHGPAWSSLIHPSTEDIQHDRASNICPICCHVLKEINPNPQQQAQSSDLCLSTPEENSTGKPTPKEKNFDFRAVRKEVSFAGDLLLGQDGVDDVATVKGALYSNERELQEQAKMSRHVAEHLRQLAFLSARLYMMEHEHSNNARENDVESLDQSDRASLGGSIESVDQKIQLVENLPAGDWTTDPHPPHSGDVLKLIAEQAVPDRDDDGTELRPKGGLTRTQLSPSEYTIGVVCALSVEKSAFVAMLDEVHEALQTPIDDENSYTFGRIGSHNIVTACLPAGMTGSLSAATVAKDMLRTFQIKIGLMVGIGGGVWSQKVDLRLGDVVVSQLEGTHGGVVQWDFGKMEQDGFKRIESLNKPPRPLLNAVQDIKKKYMMEGDELAENLSKMVQNKPRLARTFVYQGLENDCLYEATYNHAGGETCDRCAIEKIIDRLPRTTTDPQVHYGKIASGNKVVKNGESRDRIAKDLGIICFEMEAAGLMDSFPCLVIRGICDYADSHKNERWQPYAAATAAAYAKELIGVLKKQRVDELNPTGE